MKKIFGKIMNVIENSFFKYIFLTEGLLINLAATGIFIYLFGNGLAEFEEFLDFDMFEYICTFLVIFIYVQKSIVILGIIKKIRNIPFSDKFLKIYEISYFNNFVISLMAYSILTMILFEFL